MNVELGYVHARVTAATPDEERWLYGYLAFEEPGARFTAAFQNRVWDGKYHLYDRKARTFSGGFMGMVLAQAAAGNVRVGWTDVRRRPPANLAPVPWLRDYQQEALDAVLDPGLEVPGRGLVWAPTGCLVGDTKLVINRGGGARPIELKTVVARLRGEATRNRAGRLCSWDLTIPTYTQSIDQEGFVRLNRIEVGHENGEQAVFTVVTESGRVIRATAAHRFQTRDGWARLCDLRAANEIHVAVWPSNFARQLVKRSQYAQVAHMRNHPFAQVTNGARDGLVYNVPRHRLVAEAQKNGVSLAEFVGRIILGDVAGLRFLGPEWHVHHKDRDPRNNDPGNLEVLLGTDHLRQHGLEDGWKHVAGRACGERIASITEGPPEPTYDLTMAGPLHNYVANEFVVHNSGKTEIFSALGQACPCPWLVLVDTKDLLHQAAERFEKRTGEEAGRCGDGIWEPKRFTVATIQTLHRSLATPSTQRLLGDAQGIIVDEAHTLAADSFGEVLGAATGAYWRVGFSGTPLQRGDKKNVVTLGHTGSVVYKVTARELADRGILAQAAITFVRVRQPKATYDDWQGAYQGLVCLNDRRNEMVVEAALAAPSPTLVFVKDIVHGHLLHRLLSKRCKAEFVWGDTPSAARRSAVTRLRRGDADVLVTSSVFNKGIDIPEVRSLVVAAGGKSVINAIQRLGRGLRVADGKDGVQLWDFDDSGKWVSSHSKLRAQAYRDAGYDVRFEDPPARKDSAAG